MSEQKGSRATAQQRAPTSKKTPKRSLFHRLTAPACGGILTAMTPAAQRRRLEEMMKEMGYDDDHEQETAPKKIDEPPKASDTPAVPDKKPE